MPFSGFRFVHPVTKFSYQEEPWRTTCLIILERNYFRTRICKECAKKFVSWGALENHMLDRTGEKYNLRRQLVTSVETTNVKKSLEEPEDWSHRRGAYLGDWVLIFSISNVANATFEHHFKSSWQITCRKILCTLGEDGGAKYFKCCQCKISTVIHNLLKYHMQKKHKYNARLRQIIPHGLSTYYVSQVRVFPLPAFSPRWVTQNHQNMIYESWGNLWSGPSE